VIATVLGEIRADELGVTSMHEHVLSDASALHRRGVEDLDPQAIVTPELAGALRWSQLGVIDNLRLDDPEIAVDELRVAVGRGQHAVVELTSLGLGPGSAHLPEIARRSGMTIVAGFGAYLDAGLPAWYRALDESGREALFRAALLDRIPGTGFRAGLLGIMGTTAGFPTSDDERSTLRAAARAACAAGVVVVVRLDPSARHGAAVLELMRREGLPADRVVFGNVDEYPDPEYLGELSDAGAVLEVCFGGEGGHLPRVRNIHDAQRLELLVGLLADRPAARAVLGTSLWTKGQYRRMGGPGYEHLVARVVPALRSCGISAERIEMLLVGEPARLLDRSEGGA
jgi:phosphotriesterase-related protein